MTRRARAAAAAVLATLLVACAAPVPKRPPPEPESPVPRTGVVGHVAEKKERGLTRENWQDSVKLLFSNEADTNVIATRYEVTVFYDDGSSGVVTLDQKPAFQAGQRVRVQSGRIEVLRR